MEINNILVPVDFSQCSKNALQTAIALAKLSGAKIHMVNAVHVHSPHPHISGGIIEEIVSDYEEEIKKSFSDLESELIELQEVPHEADRFVAYLTDAIYTEVKKKDIDLIVMGTRSKHPITEHLLGTRATDVMDTAEVPVLILPEEHGTFHPSKIGFACEYDSDLHLQNFEMLKLICTLFDAELMAFSVVEDVSSVTQQDQKIIEKLNQALEPVRSSVRTVEAKSVTEGIKEFATSHELDLLAMIPRQKNFMDRLFKTSITKSVAIDTGFPLFVFKED